MANNEFSKKKGKKWMSVTRIMQCILNRDLSVLQANARHSRCCFWGFSYYGKSKLNTQLQVHLSVLTGLIAEEQILAKTFYFSTQIITDAMFGNIKDRSQTNAEVFF